MYSRLKHLVTKGIDKDTHIINEFFHGSGLRFFHDCLAIGVLGQHLVAFAFSCNLHEAILKSVGYPDDQMTSFFLCNDEWEKGQEVTLVEMDSNFEYDNMVMNETRLSDLIEEVGQRLIYVFDPMFERYFFGSLKEIKPGSMNGVECVESKGKAPKQLKSDDPLAGVGGGKGGNDDFMFDDEFKDELDLGDIDYEGFQDLSFDDGTMF